jgi:hypothetical protein
MTQSPAAPSLGCVCAIVMSITSAAAWGARQEDPRFRSGVDLINVTATVTDDDGRFVGDLRKEDFSVSAA